MSNQWKDRVIRGGAMAMGVITGIGCVCGLIAIALGVPAAGTASVAMFLTAAGIGLACVTAVNFPGIPPKGRLAPPRRKSRR